MRPSVPPTRRGSRALLCALCVGLAACGSTRAKVIEVDSQPRGATVFVNGEKRGTTTTRLQMKYGSDPDERQYVQVVMQGYKPMTEIWKFEELPEKPKVFE